MKESASATPRSYLPAAGHDLFLPFYDAITKLIGGDKARLRLLEQAGLQSRHRVLDVGCGTGTFEVLIKQRYPSVEVIGLDPDPKALRRAQQKAQRAGVSVQFDQGFADKLAFPDESFDRVFSSFMFHHIEHEAKQGTLREIRRVLKNGGMLHLVDFGGPKQGAGLTRLFHSNHRLHGNDEERVLSSMAGAGFSDVKVVGTGAVMFGLSRVVYYRAAAKH